MDNSNWSDADIFGINQYTADGEVIALSIDIFLKLGFKNIKAVINDRELYKDIPYKAIVAIDKLEKIGTEGVLGELEKKGFSLNDSKVLLNNVKTLKPNERISNILDYLANYGFGSYAHFSPTLARSFSYSTGPIWEIAADDFTGGSLLGGERFDSLVSRFSNKSVAGTGFALGFDRTLIAMEELGLLPDIKTKTQVLVTIFSEVLLAESIKLAKYLRYKNIQTDLYPNPTQKLDKQLKYAVKKGIPYVALLGPDEIKNGTVTLKNLKTKEQKTVTIEELSSILNRH